MAYLLNVIALTVFLGIFVNPASSQTNFCKLPSCKEKSTHTLCKYTSSKPAAACGRIASPGLTGADIQELLDSHNNYRENVASGKEKRGNPGPQPAATNLESLQWDDELASIAQRWANQCNFNHDKCRNVDRFEVGQNIAEKSSTTSTDFKLSDLVTSWYDEVSKLDKKYVKNMTEFLPDVGHYTQLVWAKTTHVGCGAIRYKSANGWNNIYLVCNYGPSGNWIGQEIYKTPE